MRKRLQQKRNFSEADLKVYKQVEKDFEPCSGDHLVLWTDEESLDEMTKKVKEYINGTETA